MFIKFLGVTHVPWCMPGSLTSGFLWSRWRGKRFRHSRRMRNRQFYISGKRPIELYSQDGHTYYEYIRSKLREHYRLWKHIIINSFDTQFLSRKFHNNNLFQHEHRLCFILTYIAWVVLCYLMEDNNHFFFRTPDTLTPTGNVDWLVHSFKGYRFIQSVPLDE